MISRIALLSGIVVLAASCADRRDAARLVGPEAMISDAVHEGGTPGFFFLPPMVAQPTVSGTFDADIATLNPQIAICDVTNDANCGGSSATLASFSTATSPAITIDPAAQQYQVNWDTKGASFVAGKTYRVHVTAGVPGARRELGFADVLLTTTPGQAKFLQSGDIIVLPDGRNLPIHVRIETGIPGSLAMSAATASVATGGTDLITAAVSDLHGAPLAGAAVAWSLTTTPANGVADAAQPLNPTSGQTGTPGTAVTAFKAGTTAGTALVTGASTGLSATLTVTVVPPPTITSFTAAATTVTNGTSTTLTAAFSGGTGAIDNGVGAVASGTSISTGPLTATTTYTLTVTNAVGVTATAGVTVTVSAGTPFYVANQDNNSVTVYAAGASGNATPIATMVGDNTHLFRPSGIARDGAGNSYVINFEQLVTVYAAGASGNAAPIAMFPSGQEPLGIALDRAGNVYVTDPDDNHFIDAIFVFAAGAGNPTLTAAIEGSNTGLQRPSGIALDGAGNIYVTNRRNNSITVYAAGASGIANAMPTATITGGNTGLSEPFGIALDGAGNIYITNFGNNSVTVYAAGASGNAIPTATIAGSNTGLAAPAGITF